MRNTPKAVLAAAAVLAAGCASLEDTAPAAPPTQPEPAAAAPARVAAAPRVPRRKPEIPVAAPRPAVEVVPAAAHGGAGGGPRHLHPVAVVGLGRGDTARLLGYPAEAAEEPPAVRWTYRGRGCELTVYFFMDVATRDFRALSYQTSGSADAHDADAACFADLVAQAGSLPAQ